MKRIRNIVFVLAALTYIVVVSGFISNTEKTRRIGRVNIRIVDSTRNQFIESKDIRKILEANKFNPIGNPAAGLNIEQLENSLRSRQIIDKAEIFVTEPGTVQVEISQKTPFVRIFNRHGQSYFLDRKGNIIPVTGGFSPFVIVANGFISEPFAVNRTLNILDVKHDSLTQSLHTIYDVYRLADFITRDDLWNSMFEQIYVNNKYEFELIPRVGSQIVEIGRVENLEEKFENLKILYHKGFNNLGWNQYEKISLKYKNQVVCTKNQ